MAITRNELKKGVAYKLTSGHSFFEDGDTVYLITDDNSDCPLFSTDPDSEAIVCYRTAYIDLKNLVPVKKTLDNLQPGDILVVDGQWREARVLLANDTHVLTEDTYDGSGDLSAWTVKELVANGYGIKSDIVELTVKEIAEKMGIPVDKLRIKD